jgi:hypothetical protein
MHCCRMIRRMVHIVYHRVEYELLLKTMCYRTACIALVISRRSGIWSTRLRERGS